MINDLDIIFKNFDNPDQTRKFEKGKFELANLPAMTIGRAVYETGQKWSDDVSLLNGTEFCEVEHLGIVLSGTVTVDFKDGKIHTVNKGDIFYVSSKLHDSWVVRSENYISIYFLGADKYVDKQFTR